MEANIPVGAGQLSEERLLKMQMAEREFRAITLCFRSTVVLYAPGQLLWDLEKRFLEDRWQLSTCCLQIPPVVFAGRFTLVKDSFRGMDNRCQDGPFTQHDSTGQILEEKKSTFLLPFFFSFLLSKLRAVTLALPLLKASLTGHHILIMPTVSWP